ncbi:MAG TPA: PKD domain-containing protein [Phnomibacter sp.]|nr:PKD domain-containing protein [Phnomibacter sp.]
MAHTLNMQSKRNLAFCCMTMIVVLLSCKKVDIAPAATPTPTTTLYNFPPVANAGADRTIVLSSQAAILSGIVSTDPENNIASYAWRMLTGPSTVTITTPTAKETSVTGLVLGVYSFELTVTDVGGLSDTDTTAITVILNQAITLCAMPGAESVAVFSAAKPELVSTVCNGKFYYTDGNTVDVFDPSTNTMLLTKYLSKPRSHVSATAAGDKVFIAGGYIYKGTTTAQGEFISIVDIYNTTTGTWGTATLSTPRIVAEGATCTIGNKVFFAGGITHTNEGSSRVDIYDLSTSSWTHRDLAVPGTYVTAVVENKVWFVTPGTSRVEVYDNATDSWGSITFNSPIYKDLPQVLSYSKAIRLGSKIYFTGYQRVPVYDIVSGTWSEISLSESKFFIPAVVSGGKIVFVGGMKSWFVYSNFMEVYDPVTNSVTIHGMSKDLFYEALISYNDYIYTAGGMVDQENTSLSSICRFRL